MPRRRRYHRNDAAGSAEMLVGLAVGGGVLWLAYKLMQGIAAVPGAIKDLPQDLGTSAAGESSALGDIVNPPAGGSWSDYVNNLGQVVGSVFGGPPVVISTPQGDISSDPYLNTYTGDQ